MSITLLNFKSTKLYRIYDLPDVVIFNDKIYKMNASANFMRVLNNRNVSLLDFFDCASSKNKKDAQIKRKKLWVPKTHEEIYEEKLISKENKKEILEKKKIRNCCICNTECMRSKYLIGTCSIECRKIKIKQRNLLCKNNHWCKSKSSDKIHEKRVIKRKENDTLLNRVYIPWNKGKVNIYSVETIKKISDSALRQFHAGVFRKTNPERIFEEILKELTIKYQYSFIYKRRQFDFLLSDKNIIIEIHGDFWHGNPKIWGTDEKPLRDHQKMKRLDDAIKKTLVENDGFKYVEFWEYDLNHNRDDVKELVKEL